MLSSIKSIELISNLLQGKRERMQSDIFVPQKPEMPEFRQDPQPLERTTPEAQGVPSEWLTAFYEAMSEKTLASHGIMVARHGKIIASGAFKPYKEWIWHISHSMCKSITGLAAGIAIDEGYFSLEDSIYDIFPEESKWQEMMRRRGICVRDLLTMSTGAAFNELSSVTEDKWVEGFIRSPEIFAPGEDFAYNSTNTFMISAIIQKTTGMKMLDYLNEKLFHPMGIYDLYWEENPEGINKGGWGLSLWIEDMVKLGILCLNRGNWKGKQLVPEYWIDEACRKQIDTPEAMNRYGYGYQFWMCRRPGAFQFNGMLGQNIVIIPDRDIVIAATGGSACLFPEGKAMDILMKYFGEDDAPFSDGPLPENGEALQKLNHTLEHLSFSGAAPAVRKIYQHKWRFKGPTMVMRPTPSRWGRMVSGIPKVMERVVGKVYEMEENTASVVPLMLQMIHNNYSMGMKGFRFTIRKDGLWLETREGDTVHRIKIGFEEPAYSSVRLNGEHYMVGSTGAVREDEDGNPVLCLMLSYVETTSTAVLKFFLDAEEILVKFDELPRVEDVAAAMDVMIPLRSLRDLNPVRKVSDWKFARDEMEKATRQQVRAFCIRKNTESKE